MGNTYHELLQASREADLKKMVACIDTLCDEGKTWPNTDDLAISSYLAKHVAYPGQFAAFWHTLHNVTTDIFQTVSAEHVFSLYQSRRKDFLASIRPLPEEEQYEILKIAAGAGNLTSENLISHHTRQEKKGLFKGPEWHLKFLGIADRGLLKKAEIHFNSLYHIATSPLHAYCTGLDHHLG